MALLARSSVLRPFALDASAHRFIQTSARPLSNYPLKLSTGSKTLNRPLAEQSLLQQNAKVSTQVAAFHTTSRRAILPPLPQRLSGTANEGAPVPTPTPMHGNYHWTMERVVSAALIPVTLAPFAGGSVHPITDALLCSLIIIHTHIGFQSVIIDYLPPKRVPKSRVFFDWVLRLGSLVVAYGFYEFETNDVGLVEAAKRMWHA